MSELSALEVHFPRLAEEIQGFWGSSECYAKLEDLLVDRRGSRQGFPAEVYSDLSLLQTLVVRPKGPYDIWSDALDAAPDA